MPFQSDYQYVMSRKRRRRNAQVEWYSVVGGRQQFSNLNAPQQDDDRAVYHVDFRNVGRSSDVHTDDGSESNIQTHQIHEDFDGQEDENNIPISPEIVTQPDTAPSPTGETIVDRTEVEVIPVPDYDELKTRNLKMTTFGTMYSIVTTTGTQRVTKSWYDFFTNTIKYLRPDVSLPLHRTVHDQLHPFLIQNCFTKSSLVRLPTATCNPIYGPTSGTNTGIGGCSRGKEIVRIILPTEWAKIDILTLPFYEDLTADRDIDDGPDIYQSPMGTLRHNVLDLKRQIIANDGTGCGRAWPEDRVEFHVRGFSQNMTNGAAMPSIWHARSLTDQVTKETVVGILGSIWMISSETTAQDFVTEILNTQHVQNCTSAEKKILEHLSKGIAMLCLRLSLNLEETDVGGELVDGDKSLGLRKVSWF